MLNGKKHGVFKRINEVDLDDTEACSEKVTKECGFAGVQSEERAGFISRALFCWITPLVRLGYKETLNFSHVGKLRVEETPAVNVATFEEYWRREKKQKRVSPFRLFVSAFGGPMYIAALVKVTADLCGFVSPLMLRRLLVFVRTVQDGTATDLYEGYYMVLLMFLASFLQPIFLHSHHIFAIRAGIRARNAVMTTVYKKSLRLSSSSLSQLTVGKITNLQANDSDKIMTLYWFFHYIWAGPLQMLITLYFLYQELGVAAITGFAVMLLVLPLQTKLQTVFTRLSREAMKYTDQRVKHIYEVIQGIRTIKFFTWEENMTNKILYARNEELKLKQRFALINAVNASCVDTIPIIVTIVAFAVYSVLNDEPLTTETVFSALTLFNILQIPLLLIPTVVNNIASASTAVTRLLALLNEPDIESIQTAHEPAVTAANRKEPYLPVQSDGPVINISNGSFSWDPKPEPDSFMLRDIHVAFPRGTLTTVIGSVGSGKSSLLAAILNEMHKRAGTVEVSGNIAYCAQSPFIMNATIKDNITFGQPFDKSRYEEVLTCSSLIHDLSLLAAGDSTEIGERGINLSGGQQARLSVARAAYSNADVILLDDVLSAVDPHVSSHIFKHLIRGLLKSKTVIFVSHQLHFLPRSDYIVVMKRGVIVQQGTFEEVKRSGSEFTDYLQQLNEEVKHESRDSSPLSRHRSGSTNREVTADMFEEIDELSSDSTTDPESSVAAAVEADVKDESSQGELIEEEERDTGAVSWKVYRAYFQSIPIGLTLIIAVTLIMSTVLRILTSWALAVWSNQGDSSYFKLYFILSFATIFAICLNQICWAVAGIVAGRFIHESMINRIMFAPTSFFDKTPTGRIVNRFTNDTDMVDSKLPVSLQSFFKVFFIVCATLLVQTAVLVWLLLLCAAVAVTFYILQSLFRSTARELRRLENLSKSPALAQLSESLSGLATIRAYRMQNRLLDSYMNKLELNACVFWASCNVNRWLGVRLEILGSVFIFVSALTSVVFCEYLDIGIIGLTLSFAIGMTGQLNWCVRFSTDSELQLTSMERMNYYCNIESEAPYVIQDRRPPSDWPQTGKIVIQDLTLRYRSNLPPVLKGLTVTLEGREKVGICGRTGAGKSSLMLAVFRIVEPLSGSIRIDGLDICSMGLKDLRSHLTIIPQDPLLFEGSLRYNLDPFSELDDATLWAALSSVSLTDLIQGLNQGLDSTVSARGENFSVGQRQLICMARAVLRRSKILILDEATASVDQFTDELLQRMMRKVFVDCTVLTIAHRISTILDSDKILVLQDGRLLEFDSPATLLQNRNGALTAMVKESEQQHSGSK
eukprot:GILJ01015055.1.p1 GENE.GILJ01015055.1~~GILJ01015055.1.p1  ORF type:complete len:1322 (+),score=218.60 GILJ01015055.1:53-4018(+)